MKTKHIFTILFLLIITFSCNKKTSENAVAKTENVAKPDFLKYEWIDFDLSKTKAKFPIIIKGIKGCFANEDVSNEITLQRSDMKMNYTVSSAPYGIDSETDNNIKKACKESDAYKFEKFILETKNSFIAKTSMGYIVYNHMIVNKIDYFFETIPLYAAQNEEDAQELYKMIGMTKAK